MKKDNYKKINFKMIGEASTSFKINDLGDSKFVIEIQGEKKFKNAWIVKINELETNLEEIEYYNQSIEDKKIGL